MRYFTILTEIWEFLMARKKWWLFLILLTLVTIGGLIVISAGSPLAPLIYTLF